MLPHPAVRDEYYEKEALSGMAAPLSSRQVHGGIRDWLRDGAFGCAFMDPTGRALNSECPPHHFRGKSGAMQRCRHIRNLQGGPSEIEALAILDAQV